MAPYAVHVTVALPWKGISEETSNVFHYDFPGNVPTEGGFLELGDKVVDQLRPLFSTQVSFKRFRVHGPTNAGKAADIMRAVKDLTGGGTNTGGGEIYSEAAVLVQSFIGRGPLGGKQYLRKFLHVYALPSSGAGGQVVVGRAQLSALDKQPFLDRFANLNTLSVGGVTNTICTPSGKQKGSGDIWQVHPYVVTRQFRRRGKRRAAA